MATNSRISDLKYGSIVNGKVFGELMENMECETGNDIEAVGFRSRADNYEISFYGEMRDGHDLTVEDFGAMINGGWVQMEPTTLQRDQMQKAILDKVEELTREPELIQYQENYGIYSELY